MAKSLGLKVHMVKVLRNDSGKSANLPAKGCSCYAPEGDMGGGFGPCFKTCMGDWGISATTLMACGAECGIAGGNPIGAAVCAACVGIQEWVVAGCVIYCVYNITKNVEPVTPLTPKSSPSHSTHVARLSLRAVR